MFSNLFSSSISLATETPSLVISGEPKGLLDDNVTAFRTQGYLDSISQCVDTTQDGVTAFLIETDLFCRHVLFLQILV
jgi:hypothetical protein